LSDSKDANGTHNDVWC